MVTVPQAGKAGISFAPAGQQGRNIFLRAIGLHRENDFNGAEFLYRQILDRDPYHADALHFLGVLAYSRGRSAESLQYIERSILLGGSGAEYRNNYGVVLLAVGRADEARLMFRKAGEFDSAYLDSQVHPAMRLLSSDNVPEPAQPGESRPQAQPKVILKSAPPIPTPESINALLAQGQQLFQQEKFHEANNVFHQAASSPGGKEIWRWKSLGFCPTVIDSEESINRYWQQLDHGLDLAIAARFPIDWRTIHIDGFTPSFNLPHHGKCCRQIKEKFAKIFEDAFPFERPDRNAIRKNRKKLRIGFVVAPGHHLGFIRVNRGILAHLNRSKFEVYLCGDAHCHAECSRRVHRNALSLVNFGNNFMKTVTQLRDMQCDVVYHWKIGGGPIDYFLPFTNPAPVQCTSIGSHSTGGIAATNYYLSSKWLEGPDAETHYTERLVCLDSYPTAHEHEPRVTASRSELKLPEKGSLYFCPHRLAKYHPCFDRYMKRILEQDTNGYILLLTGNHPDLAKIFAERLRNTLGETLMSRMILQPMIPHNQYRKYYSVATCVLDSPVYAGDLTAHDAFDADVPVVSQESPYLIGRYTLGLYRLMNMTPLVADSEQKYVEMAVRLGTDAEYRQEIRRQIAERKEAIYSSHSIVKEYEHFFERVAG